MKTTTYEGEIIENPYGNWSDVDTGYYLKDNEGRIDINILSLISESIGKTIKIIIKE